MITDAIIRVFKAAIDAVINIIPIGLGHSMGQLFTDAITFLGKPAHLFSSIIPYATLVEAIGVLISWWLFCTGYRLTLWMLGKIHVAGSGSE